MRFSPRIFLEAISVFTVAFVFFMWVLLDRQGLPTHDGFYHYQMASLLLKENLFLDIRWLPLTVLGEHGVNHHWLFHVLISPFTLVSDRMLGMTLATSFYAALVPAVLTVVGRLLKIPYAPLIALLAIVAGHIMPTRLLMLRTQNIALIFMFLSVWAMLTQRYLLLGLCSALFMYTYHGAIILIIFTFIYIVIYRLYQGIIDWRSLLVCILGISISLLLNPWYPQNIDYLIFHVFFKALNPMTGGGGIEWLRLSAWNLFQDAWVSHMSVLSAVGVFFLQKYRQQKPLKLSKDTVLFLCITVLLLLMYQRAWRFAEYYVPFAIFTAALFLRDAHVHLNVGFKEKVILPLFLCFIGWHAWVNTYETKYFSQKKEFSKIVQHLKTHAAPNTLIFNSSWTNFVSLFWHSTDFYYVNGLDVNYLAGKQPELFAAWVRISQGEIEQPRKAILNSFKTHWVVVSNWHEKLAHQLVNDPDAELKLLDDDGALFYLHDSFLEKQIEPIN